MCSCFRPAPAGSGDQDSSTHGLLGAGRIDYSIAEEERAEGEIRDGVQNCMHEACIYHGCPAAGRTMQLPDGSDD